jgi:hypothetical protein
MSTSMRARPRRSCSLIISKFVALIRSRGRDGIASLRTARLCLTVDHAIEILLLCFTEAIASMEGRDDGIPAPMKETFWSKLRELRAIRRRCQQIKLQQRQDRLLRSVNYMAKRSNFLKNPSPEKVRSQVTPPEKCRLAGRPIRYCSQIV